MRKVYVKRNDVNEVTGYSKWPTDGFIEHLDITHPDIVAFQDKVDNPPIPPGSKQKAPPPADATNAANMAALRTVMNQWRQALIDAGVWEE